jgi:hypothetical protein
MPDYRSAGRRRPLSVVGDDQLADIYVDGAGAVPMSGEQYTAAVHALAALIGAWRATQTHRTRPVAVDGEDADRPLAA